MPARTGGSRSATSRSPWRSRPRPSAAILTSLEKRGSLRRAHGGAIPVERLGIEPEVAAREGHLAAEKDRIATAALAEVPDGGSIAIDAGTTTVRLAELLP